jgi:hypothetical protein
MHTCCCELGFIGGTDDRTEKNRNRICRFLISEAIDRLMIHINRIFEQPIKPNRMVGFNRMPTLNFLRRALL